MMQNTSVKLAGQNKIILKWEKKIEFYKYLYAGGPPPAPLQILKIYPRNGKAKQMCPAVQLTSHLLQNNALASL